MDDLDESFMTIFTKEKSKTAEDATRVSKLIFLLFLSLSLFLSLVCVCMVLHSVWSLSIPVRIVCMSMVCRSVGLFIYLSACLSVCCLSVSLYLSVCLSASSAFYLFILLHYVLCIHLCIHQALLFLSHAFSPVKSTLTLLLLLKMCAFCLLVMCVCCFPSSLVLCVGVRHCKLDPWGYHWWLPVWTCGLLHEWSSECKYPSVVWQWFSNSIVAWQGTACSQIKCLFMNVNRRKWEIIVCSDENSMTMIMYLRSVCCWCWDKKMFQYSVGHLRVTALEWWYCENPSPETRIIFSTCRWQVVLYHIVSISVVCAPVFLHS